MFLFSSLNRAARLYRARRARAQTERLIASLPTEVRKDIGWPEPARTRLDETLRGYGY